MKTPKSTSPKKPDFYQAVAELIRSARTKAHYAVNFMMVKAYWNVGRMIVEEEQRGKKRAEYGAFLIKELSSRLTREFGKGFSEPSLWNMRQFYQRFPILSAVRRELTWTHYKLLIRIEKEVVRTWYMKEAVEQKLVSSRSSTANQFLLLRTPAHE